MSKKKEYLIILFLKCSKYLYTAKENLKANEDFLRASYQSINDNDFNQVMSEHSVSQFTEEMTSLVDSLFSEEEVQSLISFFSSPVGRKLVDKTHILNISNIMNDITSARQNRLSRLDRE